jgi:hypothetical protein
MSENTLPPLPQLSELEQYPEFIAYSPEDKAKFYDNYFNRRKEEAVNEDDYNLLLKEQADRNRNSVKIQAQVNHPFVTDPKYLPKELQDQAAKVYEMDQEYKFNQQEAQVEKFKAPDMEDPNRSLQIKPYKYNGQRGYSIKYPNGDIESVSGMDTKAQLTEYLKTKNDKFDGKREGVFDKLNPLAESELEGVIDAINQVSSGLEGSLNQGRKTFKSIAQGFDLGTVDEINQQVSDYFRTGDIEGAQKQKLAEAQKNLQEANASGDTKRAEDTSDYIKTLQRNLAKIDRFKTSTGLETEFVDPRLDGTEQVTFDSPGFLPSFNYTKPGEVLKKGMTPEEAAPLLKEKYIEIFNSIEESNKIGGSRVLNDYNKYLQSLPEAKRGEASALTNYFKNNLSELIPYIATTAVAAFPDIAMVVGSSVAAGAIGGPGAATATGLKVGYEREYTATLMSEMQLRAAKENVKFNADVMSAYMNDSAFMEKTREIARTRGAVIGASGAILGGATSKIVESAIEGAVKKAFIAGGIGSVTEGVGEFAARGAAGQKRDFTEVFNEAIGGLGATAVAIPAAMIDNSIKARKAAKTKEIIDEVNQRVEAAQGDGTLKSTKTPEQRIQEMKDKLAPVPRVPDPTAFEGEVEAPFVGETATGLDGKQGFPKAAQKPFAAQEQKPLGGQVQRPFVGETEQAFGEEAPSVVTPSVPVAAPVTPTAPTAPVTPTVTPTAPVTPAAAPEQTAPMEAPSVGPAPEQTAPAAPMVETASEQAAPVQETQSTENTPKQPDTIEDLKELTYLVLGEVYKPGSEMTEDQMIARFGSKNLLTTSKEIGILSLIEKMFNAGWVWDFNEKKMVNPENQNETPAEFAIKENQKNNPQSTENAPVAETPVAPVVEPAATTPSTETAPAPQVESTDPNAGRPTLMYFGKKVPYSVSIKQEGGGFKVKSVKIYLENGMYDTVRIPQELQEGGFATIEEAEAAGPKLLAEAQKKMDAEIQADKTKPATKPATGVIINGVRYTNARELIESLDAEYGGALAKILDANPAIRKALENIPVEPGNSPYFDGKKIVLSSTANLEITKAHELTHAILDVALDTVGSFNQDINSLMTDLINDESVVSKRVADIIKKVRELHSKDVNEKLSVAQYMATYINYIFDQLKKSQEFKDNPLTDPELERAYAFLSPHEFLAAIMSDPKFRDTLIGKKITPEKKSVIARIIDAIKKLFGKIGPSLPKNEFEKLISIIENAVRNPVYTPGQYKRSYNRDGSVNLGNANKEGGVTNSLDEVNQNTQLTEQSQTEEVKLNQPVITRAVFGDSQIYLSFDASGPKTNIDDIKKAFSGEDYSAEVTEFQSDFVSATSGIAKYRIDIFNKGNGAMSSAETTKKAYQNAFGTTERIANKSVTELQGSLTDRFAQVYESNVFNPAGQSKNTLNPQSTENRSDNAFSEKAYQDVEEGFKSRKKIVSMPIKDFLKLAKPIETDYRRPEAQDSFDKGIKWDSIPELRTEKGGKVRTHEGRHRAEVLLNAGYTHMPVAINDAMIRWDEANPASIPTELTSEVGNDKVPMPQLIKGRYSPQSNGIETTAGINHALGEVNQDTKDLAAVAVTAEEKETVAKQVEKDIAQNRFNDLKKEYPEILKDVEFDGTNLQQAREKVTDFLEKSFDEVDGEGKEVSEAKKVQGAKLQVNLRLALGILPEKIKETNMTDSQIGYVLDAMDYIVEATKDMANMTANKMRYFNNTLASFADGGALVGMKGVITKTFISKWKRILDEVMGQGAIFDKPISPVRSGPFGNLFSGTLGTMASLAHEVAYIGRNEVAHRFIRDLMGVFKDNIDFKQLEETAAIESWYENLNKVLPKISNQNDHMIGIAARLTQWDKAATASPLEQMVKRNTQLTDSFADADPAAGKAMGAMLAFDKEQASIVKQAYDALMSGIDLASFPDEAAAVAAIEAKLSPEQLSVLNKTRDMGKAFLPFLKNVKAVTKNVNLQDYQNYVHDSTISPQEGGESRTVKEADSMSDVLHDRKGFDPTKSYPETSIRAIAEKQAKSSAYEKHTGVERYLFRQLMSDPSFTNILDEFDNSRGISDRLIKLAEVYNESMTKNQPRAGPIWSLIESSAALVMAAKILGIDPLIKNATGGLVARLTLAGLDSEAFFNGVLYEQNMGKINGFLKKYVPTQYNRTSQYDAITGSEDRYSLLNDYRLKREIGKSWANATFFSGLRSPQAFLNMVQKEIVSRASNYSNALPERQSAFAIWTAAYIHYAKKNGTVIDAKDFLARMPHDKRAANDANDFVTMAMGYAPDKASKGSFWNGSTRTKQVISKTLFGFMQQSTGLAVTAQNQLMKSQRLLRSGDLMEANKAALVASVAMGNVLVFRAMTLALQGIVLYPVLTQYFNGADEEEKKRVILKVRKEYKDTSDRSNLGALYKDAASMVFPLFGSAPLITGAFNFGADMAGVVASTKPDGSLLEFEFKKALKVQSTEIKDQLEVLNKKIKFAEKMDLQDRPEFELMLKEEEKLMAIKDEIAAKLKFSYVTADKNKAALSPYGMYGMLGEFILKQTKSFTENDLTTEEQIEMDRLLKNQITYKDNLAGEGFLSGMIEKPYSVIRKGFMGEMGKSREDRVPTVISILEQLNGGVNPRVILERSREMLAELYAKENVEHNRKVRELQEKLK